jgi:nucleoside-diphosphate-sugar epimerase
VKILVTGGCGYKGSILVPKLLARGHEVVVVDAQWFGNFLEPHAKLSILKEDVRNIEKIPLKGINAIIHLASVANDPCSDLDPKLTWEISALATMQLAERSVSEGVGQFVYASSGSVYGVKEEEDVVEDLPLTPISEYNKAKMVAERVLLSYRDKLLVQIIRPATVCGYSPRMRLDVSVNMLTMQALTKGVMTVFGGKQVRPNIHIQDMADLYVFCIESGRRIEGIYNAGFENLSILAIAERVAQRVPAEIRITESNDPRSYRINSDKLLAAGFRPSRTVNDAIEELIAAYKGGALSDEDRFYNLRWMKRSLEGVSKR